MKFPIFSLLLLSFFDLTFASSPQVILEQKEIPTFYIQSNEPSIQWQVSDTEHFDWIHPSLEGVGEENVMILPEEAQAEMMANQEYYFRCRTLNEGTIGPWTATESFNFWEDIPVQHNWIKSQDLDQESWDQVLPHLLPFHHPLKKKLDGIFAKQRATASVKAMEKAGFSTLHLRKWDNILVAVHDKLKGYLIKTYLDDQIGISEVYELTKRINGALAIRQAIDELNYHPFFKVPKKWLYLLPESPDTRSGTQKKHFVLIAEDMSLVSSVANAKKWKKKITKDHLKALYHLLNHVGLKDSVFIANIPFSKDGKIAFVNTEHHHDWPVPFYRLTHFLYPEMQTYWNHLIMTNGKG